MEKYLEIKKAFEENGDDEKSAAMSKYMRDMFKFYGISSPVRKATYKALLKTEKASKVIDWKLLEKCYEDDHREFQYFVVDYLTSMQNFMTYDDIPNIKRYIKMKQWWDTIDGFDSIIGDIGLVDERVDDLMIEWSKDDDFWIRRVAIDHQLSRKEKTNAALLEKIIINNFGSSEFFINKAIGWSLREYSKTAPDWVRTFIAKHKEQMDKLSIREASKYI
jgi:Predicted DNA alkylation repair enzyme